MHMYTCMYVLCKAEMYVCMYVICVCRNACMDDACIYMHECINENLIKFD